MIMDPDFTHTQLESSIAGDNDNIQVQSRLNATRASDGSDDENPISDLLKIANAEARTYSGRGKAPARDSDEGVEMAEDVEIDEGVWEEDDVIDEDGDDEDDSKSVISVSSTDSKISKTSRAGITSRPWQHFSTEERAQYELMFSMVTDHAIHNSWALTEEYQREKDKEMLRYMEDWPLPNWIIGKDQANQAYLRLLERSRWRSMGVAIYGNTRLNEQIPGSVTASRLQQPLNVHPEHYARNPSEYPVQHPPLPQNVPYPPQQHPQYPHQVMQYRPAPIPHPPQQTLRSQPYAQPMQVGPGPPMPNQMNYPAPGFPRHQSAHQGMHGMPPQQMRYANVPHVHAPMPMHPDQLDGQYMQHTHHNPGPGRTSKPKPPTPPAATPPPPPPTPPYSRRLKPIERKAINKSGRRNLRKQAEADEFPWTREGIDFKAARDNASWDDTIYPSSTLDEMAIARARNAPFIHKLDVEVSEKQRAQRLHRKKDGSGGDGSSGGEGILTEKKTPPEKAKGNAGGDPYHSGNFAFASEEDKHKALALKFRTPDELIDAGEAGEVPLDDCAHVKICWNPGKKGLTQDLEQVKFSIKDTVVTRHQLARRPILTKRAAECIVDFCPDLLWRDMLLRIASEAGYGNKDVRDRFCLNGCHADKATVTKRISAALGQKQATKKNDGYREGERDWFDQSTKEFDDYIRFFGKRSSHRHMLKLQSVLGKRSKSEEDGAGGGGAEGSKSTNKRAKTGEATVSPEDHSIDDEDESGREGDEAGAHEGEGGQDKTAKINTDEVDEVSLQNSEDLDALSD